MVCLVFFIRKAIFAQVAALENPGVGCKNNTEICHLGIVCCYLLCCGRIGYYSKSIDSLQLSTLFEIELYNFSIFSARASYSTLSLLT